LAWNGEIINFGDVDGGDRGTCLWKTRKTGVTSYRRFPEYERVTACAQQITVELSCRCVIFKPLYELDWWRCGTIWICAKQKRQRPLCRPWMLCRNSFLRWIMNISRSFGVMLQFWTRTGGGLCWPAERE